MVVSTIALSLTDRAAVTRPADWVALIYAALKGKVGGELHALALETAAPEASGA